MFCYGSRSKAYVQSYGVDPRLIFSPCQAAALPHDYDGRAVLARYQSHIRHNGDAPLFLFVGRLSAEKGLPDLVAAFRKMHATLPGAKLLIVGPKNAGDNEEMSIRHQVQASGLEAAIGFMGKLNPAEIGELLEISTALVLPSHREPWGLVVNEALSYGCPVVVSDICGCTPELVLNGVTGYSFPCGNIDLLCDAMVQVIALSRNRLETAQRCMEVMSGYSPVRAAYEILEGCRKIVDRGGSKQSARLGAGSDTIPKRVKATQRD